MKQITATSCGTPEIKKLTAEELCRKYNITVTELLQLLEQHIAPQESRL